MVKLYFTYGNETREGFDSKVPSATQAIESDSVDEVQGEGVFEKVPNLITFIDEVYRILRKGSTATFSAPHYASSRAWASPLTVRALSEQSLNFSSKTWREQTKYTEATVLADFAVSGQVALEEKIMQRSEDARNFQLQHYMNVAQALLFVLTKL